jgi:hypothetical protein
VTRLGAPAAAARAIARHGLKAMKTSPSSALSTGMTTQKTTKTKVGTTLSVVSCEPAKPAYTISANPASPIAAQIGSSSLGSDVTRRSEGCSRRGRGHSTARPTNDATSTTVAAQPNSHFGIGRSSRPTKPWALAASGTATSATAATASTKSTRRRIREV